MVNEWTSNDVPSVSSLDLYNKHPELDINGKRLGAAVAFEAMVEHLNEHYPKPRPVTRDDLPSMSGVFGEVADGNELNGAGKYREAVIEHLNASGGVPVSREDAALADRLERQAASIAKLQGDLDTAERDRSSWRRAHGLVEQERITARAELAEAQLERASWRDRAEDAEARTAPAVTREDIAGVIDHWIKQGGNHEALLDDLWRWVSGEDPAVFVVRESDVAAIHVERDADGDWVVDQAECFSPTYDLNRLREYQDKLLRSAAVREAVARAIEAGQATDPVTEKARELYGVVHPDGFNDDWHNVTSETQDAYRRLARHVLGQEAKR